MRIGAAAVILLSCLTSCNYNTYEEPAPSVHPTRLTTDKVHYSRTIGDQSVVEENMRFVIKRINHKRAPENFWTVKDAFSLPPGPVDLLVENHPFDGVFTAGYLGLAELHFVAEPGAHYKVTGRYSDHASSVETWVQDESGKKVGDAATSPLQGGPDQTTYVPIFVQGR